MKPIMVFDVESLGLHGEGFAVAYVVLDGNTGKRLEENLFCCPVEKAHFAFYDRTLDDLNWIKENVLPHLPPPTHANPTEIRKAFWEAWLRWRKDGVSLWAEFAWPVEARFLLACVANDYGKRCWSGPLPLNEIGTIRGNHMGNEPRLEDELPVHNPLADARQSARLLWDELNPPPIGGRGCICDLTNGLQNHWNEKCPRYVQVY